MNVSVSLCAAAVGNHKDMSKNIMAQFCALLRMVCPTINTPHSTKGYNQHTDKTTEDKDECTTQKIYLIKNTLIQITGMSIPDIHTPIKS